MVETYKLESINVKYFMSLNIEEYASKIWQKYQIIFARRIRHGRVY